jgi:hypothetical protein
MNLVFGSKVALLEFLGIHVSNSHNSADGLSSKLCSPHHQIMQIQVFLFNPFLRLLANSIFREHSSK